MQFSVVIPLFNKAPYITRAIGSVLNQTVQDFEIIVVDDGSTDGGGDIVAEIRDSRIRLVQQENAGVSAARNKGIEVSKADHIAFLDADDEWKPGFLSAIRDLHCQYPNCGAYATSYDILDPNMILSHPSIKGIPSKKWAGIIPNFFCIVQSTKPFCSSSIVIPKKVLNHINGFPVGVKRGEDKITWVKIGVYYQIAFNSCRLSIYHREAENRVCNTIPSDYKKTEFELFLQSILQNSTLPHETKKNLHDYYSLALLSRVKNSLLAGQKDYAIRYLKEVKGTRKHFLQWSFLLVLTLFPKKFLAIIIVIYFKIAFAVRSFWMWVLKIRVQTK